MAFDNSCTKAVLSASPGQPQKGVNRNFSWRTWTSPTLFESSRSKKKLKYEVSACLAKKLKKNYSSFTFLPENLEKYRSTELYDAHLEGSTIFLYRSSTSRTPLDSSGIAESKYAFFSRTGHNTKKLQRLNLFQLTIFKHGLLEGSTILLQYSFDQV